MNDDSRASAATPQASADCLGAIDRLFVRALKALGDEGQTEIACRIAAEAWSVIRKDFPNEAERFNGALHYLSRATHRKRKETVMSDARQLDVRDLPPPQRHTLIFDTCGKLAVGDAILLVNDHDPKPLYYQFQAEQPGQFGWEYVESGPQVWQVRITRTKAA